jgi:hypothetical protein
MTIGDNRCCGLGVVCFASMSGFLILTLTVFWLVYRFYKIEAVLAKAFKKIFKNEKTIFIA